MTRLLRSLFAVAGLASVMALSAGGVQAVAINHCVDASFGKGALTCIVENKTVFSGLDQDEFGGKEPGVFKSQGNDRESDVEAALNHILGRFVDIASVGSDIGRGGNSDFKITPASHRGEFSAFKWTYGGDAPLVYMTIKAGPQFAIFDVAGLVAGSAGTENLLVNPKGKALDISHISFWTASRPAGPGKPELPGGSGNKPDPGTVAVGEPAVMGMVLVGLAGLVALGRFKRKDA